MKSGETGRHGTPPSPMAWSERMAGSPSRGEIVLMDLNPTRGREQAGVRPFLILSVDPFNRGPAELLIGIPLTTKDRRIRTHVSVDPPEGGLTERSFAMVEAVRSVS